MVVAAVHQVPPRGAKARRGASWHRASARIDGYRQFYDTKSPWANHKRNWRRTRSAAGDGQRGRSAATAAAVPALGLGRAGRFQRTSARIKFALALRHHAARQRGSTESAFSWRGRQRGSLGRRSRSLISSRAARAAWTPRLVRLLALFLPPQTPLARALPRPCTQAGAYKCTVTKQGV